MTLTLGLVHLGPSAGRAAPPSPIAAIERSKPKTMPPSAVRADDDQPAQESLTLVTHQVLPAESLSDISQRYGVTEDAIIARNNLDSTRISVGQVLKVRNL